MITKYHDGRVAIAAMMSARHFGGGGRYDAPV
jgi:hypothetical protein